MGRPSGVLRVRRVLVVDDDPAIRTVMAETLADEGHTVLEAADGLEALDVLDRAVVDVVVLDFSMPRCDGEEFARRLRERLRRRGARPIPIVLVSASNDLEERCRRVGADGCVGKPFDLDVLTASVDHVVHRHAA